MNNHLTRRHFLRTMSAGAAGLGLAAGAALVCRPIRFYGRETSYPRRQTGQNRTFPFLARNPGERRKGLDGSAAQQGLVPRQPTAIMRRASRRHGQKHWGRSTAW